MVMRTVRRMAASDQPREFRMEKRAEPSMMHTWARHCYYISTIVLLG